MKKEKDCRSTKASLILATAFLLTVVTARSLGDILFSVRAPVGRMNLARKKIVIGRGLHAIRSKTGHQAFVYQQLQEKFHEEDMMGGGTIFKSVTKKDMLNIKLLFPPRPLLDQFEDMIQPIYRILENLTDKNENLRQTRDLLLPRLISGQLDVSGIDVEVPGTSGPKHNTPAPKTDQMTSTQVPGTSAEDP